MHIVNENVEMSIKIPLKFALEGSIDTKSALLQVMGWDPIGDAPYKLRLKYHISGITSVNPRL